MSHLLAIAVGPVQEFIAAARRTRDLWFGSYLLSEISKAAAQGVKDQGGELIFPHPQTDLPPGDERVNVANVILAELTAGEPREVAAIAKQAANDRWLEFVKDAGEVARGVVRKELWDDQANDVIEFYAAWIVGSSDYGADRGKLMRLLAGRKNCRDFLPAKGRAGVPKSSLDGQRESVLKDPTRERWPERFRTRLRIRVGEQLDVVGVVKRAAEGQRPYPSVSRIAADPWVRGNKGERPFADLTGACDELPPRVLHRLDMEAFPKFQDFPYEGTAIYKTRHHEWEDEVGAEDWVSIGGVQDALSKLPDPAPYLAVVVADGDRMGTTISKLPLADDNRKFSRTLSGFADAARKIVTDHHGVLVYAGGDDVLAFVPVDKCLQCARQLHDDFGSLLKDYEVGEGQSPTLSVGIAIGHFMENLEDLLEYGRAAEKSAKQVEGKDALAVHLHKRGGAPITISRRWEHEPDAKLTLYSELMQREALPSKLPYDLQQLVGLYEAEGWAEADRLAAMRQDALRIIADKQPRAGRAYMNQVRQIVQNLASVKELAQLCEQLLISRLLAHVFEQAKRPPTMLSLERRREDVA